MNIYLIEQNIVTGCDTYTAAVVCAESESEARKIHPADRWNEWAEWVELKDIDKIKVTYLGKAEEKSKAGVILASYNAG